MSGLVGQCGEGRGTREALRSGWLLAARIPSLAPGPAPLRGEAGEASLPQPAGSLGSRVTGRGDGGGTP